MRLGIVRSHLFWQWVVLAVAAPVLAFPTPSRTPALLLIPVLWGAARLTGHRAFPRTPLSPALLLLSIMVLVSTWATYDIHASLPKIAGVVLGIGAFSVLARHDSRPQIWWFAFAAFLAVGCAIAGVSLVSTRWVAKLGILVPVIDRLPGPIVILPGTEGAGINANEVAGALTWVVPPVLCLAGLLALRRRRLVSRVGRVSSITLVGVAITVALFLTGILVLTQSRSAYFGVVCAIPALTAFALPRDKRAAVLGLAVLAVVALGILGWQYGPDAVVQPLFEQSGNPLNSLEGRREIWSRALYGLQDFVFTGMGMNTFREVVHVLYPLFLISPETDIAHAHNEFLQAGLDLGVPGLIAFVALYLGAFGMLGSIWHVAERLNQDDLWLAPGTVRALVLGLGGGLFAHLMYGVTDAVALGAKPGILFWMLLGLVAGLYQQPAVRQARLARGQPRSHHRDIAAHLAAAHVAQTSE